MKIRVATRGSKLSRIQTELVLNALKKVDPDLEFELIFVKTTGDRFQDRPLHAIGGKGLFEKEVNKAVLEGHADIAVHSLKDVPAQVSEELVLATVIPRDPPFDVLVSKTGEPVTLSDLPSGAVIGTSSTRRKAMILHVRPDLRVEPLRGNVDTRLRKVREGLYDAAVLAEAGLVRLGAEVKYWRIPPEIVTPAPCQGIIGVYARKNDTDLLRLLERIRDPKAWAEALAEREFLKRVGGGCFTPVGCLATVTSPTEMKMIASLLSPDGKRKVFVEDRGSPDTPEQLGARVAEKIRSEGGDLLCK